MSSIFTKIVRGEVPCYKIYEDERTMAFLDIEPEAPGHTLVVPKVEVDKIYDLPDEDYAAVMATVKKLAKHFEGVLGERIMIKVIGVDVPHAHVHVLPVGAAEGVSGSAGEARASGDDGAQVLSEGKARARMTLEEMEEMAKRLRVK